MLGKAEMCMKRLIKEKGGMCWSGERDPSKYGTVCQGTGVILLYIYIYIYTVQPVLCNPISMKHLPTM